MNSTIDQQTYDIENQMTSMCVMEHVVDIEAPVVNVAQPVVTIEPLDRNFFTPVRHIIRRWVSEEIVWIPEIQDLLDNNIILSPPRLIRSATSTSPM